MANTVIEKNDWNRLKKEGGEISDVTLAVADLKEKVSRAGNTYAAFTFSDGDSSFTANMFSTSIKQLKDMGIEKGSIITVTIKAENGFLNVADNIRNAPAEGRERFALKAPIDPEAAFEEIISMIESVHEPGDEFSISYLTLNILQNNKKAFTTSSAACSHHHNVLGGLIWHVLRMMRAADKIADVYTCLNKRLLLCGTALHDIGKICSLKTDDLGNAEMTPKGVLLDHSVLGIMMIDSFVNSNDILIYNDDLELLEHMIASHHGQREYGAIQLPAIPEAMILSNLDMIDSRMYMYEKVLETTEEGCLSDYIKDLGTSVYNPNNSIY